MKERPILFSGPMIARVPLHWPRRAGTRAELLAADRYGGIPCVEVDGVLLGLICLHPFVGGAHRGVMAGSVRWCPSCRHDSGVVAYEAAGVP